MPAQRQALSLSPTSRHPAIQSASPSIMQFSRRPAAVQHSSDAASPSWLHVLFHHGHNLTFIPAPSAAATLHSGHVDTSPPLAIKPNRFAFRLHDGPRLRAVQPGVHFRPSGSGIGAGVPMPLLPSCSVSWCVCLPPSPNCPVQPGASKSGATVLHNHGGCPLHDATPPPSHHHQTSHQGTCRTSHGAAGGMDHGDLAQLTQWPMTSPGDEH